LSSTSGAASSPGGWTTAAASEVFDESSDTDKQYEGCPPFFDVRGLVPPPRRLEVAHTTLDGVRITTVFTDALARLVGHEVDHLHGRLYLDRMPEGRQPIPAETSKGTGQAWAYR
jgi:peptide deformylase